MTARPRSRHFADLLDEHVARDPTHAFVVFEDETVSYGELADRARRVARGLHAAGVRPGARVALLASNRPEWLEVAFGTFRLGATLVPLSTWYRPWDLQYALAHCEAELLVTMPSFHGNDYVSYLEELAPELRDADAAAPLQLAAFPRLRRVAVLGGPVPRWAVPFDELVEAVGGDELARPHSPDDLAYVLYTSGSTAAPKGVMVTHRGCVENGFEIGERQHLGPADRVWVVVSLAWGLGCENALPALLTHGSTIVLQESFDAPAALRLFERARVTAIYTTPNIVHALADERRRSDADLSSLRTGVGFGGPAELRRAIEELGVRELCNIYGSTETYGNSCVADGHDPVELRVESQGPPLPGMEVRIVDPESGAGLPPGEVGEIEIGGRVAEGYWRDPELTRTSFPGGRYRSGDLGYLDASGRLHFVGRIKEMIKTGGINVAPAEVEQFLMTHPQVSEAYVVGVPDEARAELVVAFVRAPEGALRADGLLEYCRGRIASYKIPARVHVLDPEADVPRTATGKVAKAELAKLARSLGARA